MESVITQIFIQVVFLMYPVWRICHKVGLNPKVALWVLIPGFGALIPAFILLSAKWQVQPAGSKFHHG